MVVLTVGTNSNPHTLYFDHPIEKPNSIRLLSASFFNSWYNLKQNASIVCLDLNTNKTFSKTLITGHYTLEQLAKIIKEAFTDRSVDLKAELNTIRGGLTISNPNTVDLQLSSNLVKFLGLGADFNGILDVKQLTSPGTYFVHCDLIDKRQNLLNGKPSTVLARFDVRGKPFEKVYYQTPQPHVLRETDSGDYDVNSITLSVKDENGNLFDFNSMPLEFELEIN